MAAQRQAPAFKPNTVYVIYIASTAEKVWTALTSAEHTRQYFFGRSVEIDHRVGGDFEMRKLPECLVTFQIDALGEAVRLTMTEAHQWDVPDEILAGGRQGWPLILSSLKSLLEAGKPIVVKMEPPKEMLEAMRQAMPPTS